MQTCPKCGYVRKADDKSPDTICPSCGIVYAKFNPNLHHGTAAHAPGPTAHPVRAGAARLIGLSGNEMYCLAVRHLEAGDLVVGNSVHSLGFVGGLGSMFKTVFGGEVSEITEIIADGRRAAHKRMHEEATRHGAIGITGVTSQLRHFAGNIEFLSLGTCVHRTEKTDHAMEKFSNSGDAQALYCMLDAGYTPRAFAFGNIAYSIGVGGGVLGALKTLGRGEVKEYSDVFNKTRHQALARIVADAKRVNANCVVGIVTTVNNFQGAHEMIMLGTAAHHPLLGVTPGAGPATSDLTCEEMWNLAAMGYAPVKLLISTAVYSLGVAGGIKSMFKSFVRGELPELTSLLYDAREHALDNMRAEAESLGADRVVGVKTHIHEMGSLVEFMAIGTAVTRVAGVKPHSPQLPPQAITWDQDTWVSGSYFSFGTTD